MRGLDFQYNSIPVATESHPLYSWTLRHSSPHLPFLTPFLIHFTLPPSLYPPSISLHLYTYLLHKTPSQPHNQPTTRLASTTQPTNQEGYSWNVTSIPDNRLPFYFPEDDIELSSQVSSHLFINLEVPVTHPYLSS